jgi:ERG8-type phosphomevalonate kinase
MNHASGRDIIHNLAQISHCAAQGKIGSGFDVSSAVYGSQVYTRFSPQLISNLLSKPESPSSAELGSVIQRHWDNEVVPFSLPPNVAAPRSSNILGGAIFTTTQYVAAPRRCECRLKHACDG